MGHPRRESHRFMEQIVRKPRPETNIAIEAALGLDSKGRSKRRGRRRWLYALAAIAAIGAGSRRLFLAVAGDGAKIVYNTVRCRKGRPHRHGFGDRHAAAADPGRHFQRIVGRGAHRRGRRERPRPQGRRAGRARHHAARPRRSRAPRPRPRRPPPGSTMPAPR